MVLRSSESLEVICGLKVIDYIPVAKVLFRSDRSRTCKNSHRIEWIGR